MQTSKMERLTKIVLRNAKRFILDVWQGSGYAPVYPYFCGLELSSSFFIIEENLLINQFSWFVDVNELLHSYALTLKIILMLIDFAMSEGQPQIFQNREDFSELGHFDKPFVKTQE